MFFKENVPFIKHEIIDQPDRCIFILTRWHSDNVLKLLNEYHRIGVSGEWSGDNEEMTILNTLRNITAATPGITKSFLHQERSSRASRGKLLDQDRVELVM